MRGENILNKIFSIKDIGIDHKQINLLGLRIKFASKIRDQKFYHHLPIQNNKIVFRNHIGSYGCNIKYIIEEILAQNLPYDIVCVVNENILNFIQDYPKNIRLVMTHTPEAYKEYATARIFVDTGSRESYIYKGLFKRTGQVYIQCFHGAFGIKKCGLDRADRSKKMLRAYLADVEQIDFLISNSLQATRFYTSVFSGSSKIVDFGQPRNDIFFKDNSIIKEKIYKHFNIQNDKKIILFAPTFREKQDTNCYMIDFEQLLKNMSKKYCEKYVVIYRLHPKFRNLREKLIKPCEYIYDATDYGDMQELLVSADILITDYSSCIYDFMLSYKPGFIFATDMKEYESSRGLYYSLSSTPFPIAENNDELIKNIQNFDYEVYKQKVKNFLKSNECIDDGNASKRVVELIKQIMSYNR